MQEEGSAGRKIKGRKEMSTKLVKREKRRTKGKREKSKQTQERTRR